MTEEDPDSAHSEILRLFFGSNETMQKTLAVLCESNHKLQGDVVTQTVLTMLSAPIQVQLTAVGWQPFKGRELTLPYTRMTIDQRQAFKALLDERPGRWQAYEHAIIYRHPFAPLKQLQVLEALCSNVLASAAYSDKRQRLAICNILLQRVQANTPIERSVQSALNERLFPPSPLPDNKP